MRSMSTAGGRAYRYIRERILDGRLRSGENITQAEIAGALNLSRIPVRDALRMLADEGLVVIQSNQRASVTKLGVPELKEVFKIRSVLEGLAAREAVRSLTVEDFLTLEVCVAYMSEAPTTEDYIVSHEKFHDLVAERAGMPRLRQELRELRELITPYVRIHGIGFQSLELTRKTHTELVSVLRSGIESGAEEVFRAHVQASSEETISVLEALMR